MSLTHAELLANPIYKGAEIIHNQCDMIVLQLGDAIDGEKLTPASIDQYYAPLQPAVQALCQQAGLTQKTDLEGLYKVLRNASIASAERLPEFEQFSQLLESHGLGQKSQIIPPITPEQTGAIFQALSAHYSHRNFPRHGAKTSSELMQEAPLLLQVACAAAKADIAHWQEGLIDSDALRAHLVSGLSRFSEELRTAAYVMTESAATQRHTRRS